MEVKSLKNPANGKTKNPQNLVGKLIINKHKNIFVGVQWNNIPLTIWKLCKWSHNAEWMVEGQTEDLWRKGWPSLLCHLHNLYSVMTVSISCFYFRHLPMNWSNWKKWLSEVSATCTPFFGALTVSWGLDMSESSCSLSAVHCSRFASSVNSAAGELTMPQLSASSNMGILWELFVLTWGFCISYCQLGNPWKSLTASGQSYFQQPFWVTDSANPWPPACSHPWCCRVYSEGSNAWISWRLLRWVATVVRWFSWGYSVQLFWWSRPKSCRFKNTEALQC